MEVTSIKTTIVVYCKYIFALILYFWIDFIYSATPVIGVSYTKLINLFKRARKQNFTLNPFWLCVHWSQVLVGTIEFRWNHYSHYFALENMTIFLPTHCFRWTVFNSENGLRPFPSHCDDPKFTPFDLFTDYYKCQCREGLFLDKTQDCW